MRKKIIISASLIVILVIAGTLFIFSGVYDISATASHTGMVRWILTTVKENSIRSRAGKIETPDFSDPGLVETGLHHYHAMCVTCHGAPGISASAIGMGLNPPPADLSKSAEEFNEAELYWAVKNGIKMTGMPAYGPTHPDPILWSIVAFLRTLPDLTPEEYEGILNKAGSGETEITHEHDSHSH